jgi:hypothetical protein
MSIRYLSSFTLKTTLGSIGRGFGIIRNFIYCLVGLSAASALSAQTVCTTYRSCDPTKLQPQDFCTYLTDAGGSYYLELVTRSVNSEEIVGNLELSYVPTDAMFMRKIATGEWIIERIEPGRFQFTMGSFDRRDIAAQRRSMFGIAASDAWSSRVGGAFIEPNSLYLGFDSVFTSLKTWTLRGDCTR